MNRLIACPHCDALLQQTPLDVTQRAICPRCNSVLVSSRQRSFLHIVSLSTTAAILMLGAVFFPFLGVSSHGFSHAASVFEVALAFAHGWLAPLTAVLLIAIVGLPMLRFGLLIYTLWPLSFGRPPWRHARFTFRLSEQLTPWSMAEIFIVGTAVALVKIGGLASISLGPAFWAFCALIIVTVLENSFMSKWSIWEAIDRK